MLSVPFLLLCWMSLCQASLCWLYWRHCYCPKGQITITHIILWWPNVFICPRLCTIEHETSRCSKWSNLHPSLTFMTDATNLQYMVNMLCSVMIFYHFCHTILTKIIQFLQVIDCTLQMIQIILYLLIPLILMLPIGSCFSPFPCYTYWPIGFLFFVSGQLILPLQYSKLAKIKSSKLTLLKI